MPYRPLNACRVTRCPEREVSAGSGYCEEHIPDARAPRRQEDRERGSASSRGLGRRWAGIAKRHRDLEPFCRSCARLGRTTPIAGKLAGAVDHIIPRRLEGSPAVKVYLARHGLPSIHAAELLQSLCHGCHNRKTADERALRRARGLSTVEGLERWVRRWSRPEEV